MLNVSEGFSALRKESGQVVVFFALFIPVAFGLAAIVMDIGNWYVHKRHLQTQVDAAALAPAPQFTGCFDPAAWSGVDTEVRRNALGYAGDTQRLGVLGSSTAATTNLQVEEPNDVRIVLNSSRYWQESDGTAQGMAGYSNVPDNTLDSNSNDDMRFCDEKSIDVKATDDKVSLLWGLIPVHPSPKSRARAALFWEEGKRGILPFAVPEVVPGAVIAIFVNETPGSADFGTVLGANKLNPTAGPPDEFSLYTNAAAATFSTGDGKEDIGVIILLSRSDIPNPSTSGTLTEICTQTDRKSVV